MLRSTFCLLLLLSTSLLFAQKKSDATNAIKFGDVKPADFAPLYYSVDSNANAIVLNDIGKTEFRDGSRGDLTLGFSRHMRARILNKNGFDIATVSIPLFVRGSDAERIVNLEAFSYNLEDDKVVATKLDGGSVFYEKLNKYFKLAKFTFPNIKAGSIIEYRYDLYSPFYDNLQPWYFQGDYPVLWSEYYATIPTFFRYISLNQHYYEYDKYEAQPGEEYYSIRIPGGVSSDDIINIKTSITKYHWLLKDLPALKEEDHVSNTKNYVEKIEFQLSAIAIPNQPIVNVLGDWKKFSERLMEDEDFGKGIKSNGWLKDDAKQIAEKGATDMEKAKLLFRYFHDNFKCTDDDDNELSQSLKKTFQLKMGNVADINILLTAALTAIGLKAEPALLSTRDHGTASAIFPLWRKFNYVVCCLDLDGQRYLLDASDQQVGFGKLGPRCYSINGHARLVDESPYFIPLVQDSIKEQKHTSVFLFNDSSGNVGGSVTTNLGYYESTLLRKKLTGKSNDIFFKEIHDEYSFPVTISAGQIDSLKLLDETVSYNYEISFSPENADVIYFNPLLNEAVKTNPFKAGQRLYPIEMPYRTSDLYTLQMEVPKGYKIDEMPQSVRVNFNENEGMFEYIIRDNQDGTLTMRCRIEIYKAIFSAQDYEALRDFFGYIVKKETEQVVFKKVK